MSTPAIRLLFFGTISILLLSAFSIWRIFLDRVRVNEISDRSHEVLSARQDIDQMILLLNRSKLLITTWVYVPVDNDSKHHLTELQNLDYPNLKARLRNQANSWTSPATALLSLALQKSDSLFRIQRREIMGVLMSFENYDNAVTSLMARNTLRSEVVPLTNEALVPLATLREQFAVESNLARVELQERSAWGDSISIFIGGLTFLSGVIGMVIVLMSPAWKNRLAVDQKKK